MISCYVCLGYGPIQKLGIPSRLFQRENRRQQLADAKFLRTNLCTINHDFALINHQGASSQEISLVHLLIEAPYRLISAHAQF